MNLLSKLFARKTDGKASTQGKSKPKEEIFYFFQQGKECYNNNKLEQALSYFDEALENGFLYNFPIDVAELYHMRGCCLQALDYHYEAIDDFSNVILFTSDDCNQYFLRSISKGAIMDYEGEISDLEKAIKLSRISNSVNKFYDARAQKMGWKNASSMYELSLESARTSLDFDTDSKKRIEEAETPEIKLIFQQHYDKFRGYKLDRLKRRTRAKNHLEI